MKAHARIWLTLKAWTAVWRRPDDDPLKGPKKSAQMPRPTVSSQLQLGDSPITHDPILRRARFDRGGPGEIPGPQTLGQSAMFVRVPPGPPLSAT